MQQLTSSFSKNKKVVGTLRQLSAKESPFRLTNTVSNFIFRQKRQTRYNGLALLNFIQILL